MARCVISPVLNTDEGGWPLLPACVVHTAMAPCRHGGEPACPTPLHTDLRGGRALVIETWQARTLGQRPLVIHNGDMTDAHHSLGDRAMCRCGPEVLRAEEITDGN